MERVLEAGGTLYTTYGLLHTERLRILSIKNISEFEEKERKLDEEGLEGNREPWKIRPGGLLSSRSFGDVLSKNVEVGGVEGMIIAKPEVKIIDFDHSSSFAILGSNDIW